jgi:hypothetical protein
MFVLPQDHNRHVTGGYNAKFATPKDRGLLQNHNSQNNHTRIVNNLAHIYSAYQYKGLIKPDKA